MIFRSSHSLLAILFAFFPLSRAGPGWVRLSLIGPGSIEDLQGYNYYVNNILVGTPPATQSLMLNIGSPVLAFSSDDCVFCPGSDMFRPSLSSTYNSTNQPWPGLKKVEFGGVMGQDTVSFGGVLTSEDISLRLIKTMSQNYTRRFLDGFLGIYVNASTETTRKEHILTHLHSSGQLLNPVVGIRLGQNLETSQISIGALDPNDFEGTINWVQAETPDPLWDSAAVIKIDGFRGFNGSFLPFENPLPTYLSADNRDILMPNSWPYIFQKGYHGPVDSIEVDLSNPDSATYSYQCNETEPYVHLSVDINGVNYQLDSKGNLLHNTAVDVVPGYCKVAINNLTTTASIPSLLGLPFMRSVYMAYRFPTEDCPNAYYGFAFPKGANRTSSMISQQPRETPSASAQCLSFATPTSTPTVLTPAPQASADQFVSAETYDVWLEDGQHARLKGVDELPSKGLIRGLEAEDE